MALSVDWYVYACTRVFKIAVAVFTATAIPKEPEMAPVVTSERRVSAHALTVMSFADIDGVSPETVCPFSFSARPTRAVTSDTERTSTTDTPTALAPLMPMATDVLTARATEDDCSCASTSISPAATTTASPTISEITVLSTSISMTRPPPAIATAPAATDATTASSPCALFAVTSALTSTSPPIKN